MSSNTEFNNIIEFNDYISKYSSKYDITNYFTKIHELFNNNVDISFMGYFLSLIEKKDEFCVEHQKLIEYGIINSGRTNDIKKCIEDYDFKENIDYLVLTAERSAVKRVGRGGSNGNAKYYKMKPHVFKMCLMRSKNENKYAKYFLELEECFYYYKDYQIKYQEVLLSGKDEKHEKHVEEAKKRHADLTKQYEELLKFAKDGVKERNDLNENINDLHDKADEINEHLNDVKEKLNDATEDRAPKPEDPKFTNSFIVFKIGVVKYYVLKWQ